MSIKKPSIPSLSALPAPLASVLGPVKENIELITGVRGGQLAALPADATLSDVINTLNSLIARINASGA